MKVLLVSTNDLGDNGISTFIINNAKLLANEPDVQMDVLAPNEVDSKIKEDLATSGIRVFRIPNRNSKQLEYFKALVALLKKEKYDVLHVNGSSTIMSIELAAGFFAGVKVRIAHSHNTVTEHESLNKALRPAFEMFVNQRLACNEAAGKWLFKNKPFTVIDNGIFLDRYQYKQDTRNKVRKNLGISPDTILLGHVGGFNYQKNQAFLLKLLKRLPINYKLVLIGQGQLFDEVKAESEELILSDRVIFTGSINNVPDYLSAMDAFVLPSRFEGQPFVLIEASANGLPIIASEKVSQEVNLTGKIKFVPLKAELWSRSIQDLDHIDRLVESQDNCEQLAYEGYDINTNAVKLFKFYQKAMS